MLLSIGAVAAVALRFGPSEMFLIAIAGVTVLGAVGTASVPKTIASGVFGLLVGTVGIVPTGEWRATFNNPYLAEGVPFIPILIGMFVLSELMMMTFRDYVIDSTITVQRSLRGIMRGFRLPRWVMPAFLQSTGLGIIIGLPAAGGTAASFAAYSLARKTSARPEEYGNGSVEGVVASESANNACSGGDIMTTLVLGVPGSATTGILLGALTMHGLQAGPNFVAQQGDLVYGIIAAAIISQVFMVVAAVFAAYSVSLARLACRHACWSPILLLCSVMGAYASRGAAFDVYLMLGFGGLGYLMKRTGYSTASFVMGVLLSPIADNELIRMFQLYGEDWYLAFVTRPLSAALLGLFAIIIAWSIYGRTKDARRRAEERLAPADARLRD